jgi:hypothetical protein
MAALKSIIKFITLIATLIGSFEAIIKLAKFAWALILKLLKKRASFQMSFAGLRV